MSTKIDAFERMICVSQNLSKESTQRDHSYKLRMTPV